MKFTIRAKLLIAFTLMLVLTSAVNIYGLIQMERLAGLTTKIYNHPLQVTRAVLTANTDIIKMQRDMKEIILAQNITDIEAAQNQVAKYEQAVYKQCAIVKQWILGQEGAKLIADTIQIFRDWAPIREEVIVLMKKGQQEKASAITKGKGARHVALLDRQMETLKNYAANKANGMYDSAQTTRKIVIATTIIALILVVITTAFACLALIVPVLLGPRKPTETKLLPYESGKIPFGDARRRFPVKYYITAMLFIVLDIAVIFLYPWATVFRDLKVFGLAAMAVFVAILLVGYIYIWKKGALEWD